jgi:ABC-type glycerol-3-phosphate transport system substrate-binding protein
LIDEFEAQYPNIKVEVVITTWDTMEGQIRTALNGNNAPDVITDLESRVASYASQGLLANLDSYYTASNVDMTISSPQPSTWPRMMVACMPCRCATTGRP